MTGRDAEVTQQIERILTQTDQALFGIVQGGTFQDLRDASADATVAIGFEGYAIGGLSVGEPSDVMYAVAEATAKIKKRY